MLANDLIRCFTVICFMLSRKLAFDSRKEDSKNSLRRYTLAVVQKILQTQICGTISHSSERSLMSSCRVPFGHLPLWHLQMRMLLTAWLAMTTSSREPACTLAVQRQRIRSVIRIFMVMSGLVSGRVSVEVGMEAAGMETASAARGITLGVEAAVQVGVGAWGWPDRMQW